jgi:hypothetical protein
MLMCYVQVYTTAIDKTLKTDCDGYWAKNNVGNCKSWLLK